LGIHCHIGSQITDMRTYERAIEVLVDFAKRLHAEGGAICAILNVGGGLAAGEQHESAGVGPEAWASTIFSALEGTLAGSALPRPRIFVEPGRSVVAAAGTTLYRIGVRKTMPDGSEALIVDGGLSDNPRPALYEARYSVRLVGRAGDAPDGTYTVFGRHCETDLLFPAVALPDPQPGDLLAVSDTGAYTYSMASNYNRFSRPAVVLARDGRARLIARREPLEHVLDLDVIETA
jgi:diaminopimelate decarboxylase